MSLVNLDRELAEQDARMTGTGFLVDGKHVAPSSVTVISQPQPVAEGDLGFIVSNGQDNAWRMWGESGPVWTPDRNKALRFARREDAEAFARDDEDAWHIQPYALRAQPAGGGEDWQARALSAEADIERMTDAFNRENGPTFMGEPVLPPEKMVELEPGVRVPKWLLDDTRRVELYMKAHLPGPWRIGGIQSHDYANATPPESGGQGEAVAEVCRPGHPRPDSATYVRMLRDNIPDGTKLYAHPPAQASGAVTDALRVVRLRLRGTDMEREIVRRPGLLDMPLGQYIDRALAQGGGK